MAVVDPMPRARVRMASRANRGFLAGHACRLDCGMVGMVRSGTISRCYTALQKFPSQFHAAGIVHREYLHGGAAGRAGPFNAFALKYKVL